MNPNATLLYLASIPNFADIIYLNMLVDKVSLSRLLSTELKVKVKSRLLLSKISTFLNAKVYPPSSDKSVLKPLPDEVILSLLPAIAITNGSSGTT